MPQNKRKKPVLVISKIGNLQEKFLGEGRTNKVYSSKTTQNGVRFNLVRKKAKLHTAVRALEKFPVANQNFKRRLIATNKIWYSFYMAGLPVPRYRKIDLRTGKGSRVDKEGNPIKITNKNYLSVFERNVAGKKKLIQVHDSFYGNPVFFNILSLPKDKKLAINLAKDFATITNLGFDTTHFDFWELRKKGNTFERRIVDIDSESILRKSNLFLSESIPKKLNILKLHMDGAVFKLFLQTYLSNIKSKQILQAVKNEKKLWSDYKIIGPSEQSFGSALAERNW